MKQSRFFMVSIILVSFFISCDLFIDENEIDYESLLPIDGKLDLKGLFEKANDPAEIYKYMVGSNEIENYDQQYSIWMKKESAFKIATLSNTSLLKIALFVDYNALKITNPGMTDFTLTLYSGDNAVDTFSVQEFYIGNWYVSKNKFENFIVSDGIGLRIEANYIFVPDNGDTRELSFIINEIEEIELPNSNPVYSASITKYIDKIAELGAARGKTLQYSTNFQDEGIVEWGGNLVEIDKLADHIELLGSEQWKSINRTNEIQRGTDVFIIMKFSEGMQFNTGLTRGFWDNKDGDIFVQVGLLDMSGASGILGLNIVNSKETTLGSSWGKQDFIPMPNTEYLVQTQLGADGTCKLIVYNENFQTCEFEIPFIVPDAQYSYEFTVNIGTMSLYKYFEYY